MLEKIMYRWFIAMTIIAVMVVAIQLMPYGRDYAGEREQRARGVVATGGVADDEEEPAIPASLSIEHRELHATLDAITKLPGTTGMAAFRVAELIHGHFRSEEEFAMPPLALLRPLAEGAAVQASAQTATVAMSDRLKADWPRMLHEHKAIRDSLSVLAVEARAENRPEVLRFVETLTRHAQQEEEILYPAAILVGEYLKLKGSK
jgi:hypothetical protein